MHEGTSSAGDTGSTQVSWAKSVDTKGLLKCDVYYGEKELFVDWKKSFYSTLELIDKTWVPRLRKIEEEELDLVIEFDKLSDEDKEKAKGIETFLIHLCKGDAETRI